MGLKRQVPVRASRLPRRHVAHERALRRHAVRARSFVPGVTAPGDSDVYRQQCSEMLDELLRVGVLVDPGTQLACVCEVR